MLVFFSDCLWYERLLNDLLSRSSLKSLYSSKCQLVNNQWSSIYSENHTGNHTTICAFPGKVIEPFYELVSQLVYLG